VIERERQRIAFLRSQPKWQYLSKYGKAYDGNKIYEKSKKKPHIDKYFYMTMAEIRNSLVWRATGPLLKDKNWTYTFRP
jgi:hypothetical protein